MAAAGRHSTGRAAAASAFLSWPEPPAMSLLELAVS